MLLSPCCFSLHCDITFHCIFWLLFVCYYIFFLGSRYLATIFTLLHCSFCVLALFFSHYFTFLALMCYSFHVTLLFFPCCCIVLLTLPLLFFLWCPCCFSNIVTLLFSHYIVILLTLSLLSCWCYQSSSTCLPNSWCCYYHVNIVDSLVGMVFPFPFLPCVGWSSNTKFLNTKSEFFGGLFSFFYFILCYSFDNVLIF